MNRPDMPAPGTGATSSLRIDGEMTIYRAAELKQALLAPLDGGASLDVDLSGVTEFDTAGVQLLILASHEARNRGLALRLIAESSVVADVLRLFGLYACFGDSSVMPAAAASSSPCRSNP